jgi:hypothetical protein
LYSLTNPNSKEGYHTQALWFIPKITAIAMMRGKINLTINSNK